MGGAIHDQELVLEEKGLRTHGTDPTRSEQTGHGGDQVDKKNDQIAHRRMVAGRGILRHHGRNNNSPATGSTSPLNPALTTSIHSVCHPSGTSVKSNPPVSSPK